MLNSRGSVIPIFKRQIQKGGPVTLTNPEMTRFIMTIEEATRLVIDSSLLAKGGEVFVTKMPIIRIQDLAECMIEKMAPLYGYKAEDIKIEVIGSKPGEKLYEELMSDEETRRTCELDNYFSVKPAFGNVVEDICYDYPRKLSDSIDRPYNSKLEKAMTKKELADFLEKHQLFLVDK